MYSSQPLNIKNFATAVCESTDKCYNAKQLNKSHEPQNRDDHFNEEVPIPKIQGKGDI